MSKPIASNHGSKGQFEILSLSPLARFFLIKRRKQFLW
jgi:hypothetical protein